MAFQNCHRLLKLFILISCSFQYVHGTYTNHESDTLIDFGDNFVRGMTQYGSLLVVALKDEVVFKKPSDHITYTSWGKSQFSVNDTGSIKLEGYLIGEKSLLEFKMINDSAVLACTTRGCSICYKETSATCAHLGFPYISIFQAAASFVDDKVFLRSVYSTNTTKDKSIKTVTSIDIFEPVGLYQYERVKTNRESEFYMSDHTVVAAFSTPTHTYFVGSSKRLDLALKGSNEGSDLYANELRNNTEIRIARVCNNDQTKDLDSRIDLVLSCDNIDYTRIDDVIVNYATGALYRPESQKLIIAMRNRKMVSTICEYNFKEMQARFDHTWITCQSIDAGKDTESECKNIDYHKLPDKCFMFTMAKNEPLPYCSAVNGFLNQYSTQNCNMHMTNNTERRYVRLENFRPFNGKALYTGSRSFVVLRETNDPRTLFVIEDDNKMRRLELDMNKTDNSLMWRPARAGAHMLEFLKTKDQVLFVDPRDDSTINNLHISCEELYRTCKNISWDDPLNCGYCVNPDGTGTVMQKSKLNCPTGNMLENVCPPVIDFFKHMIDEYLVEGQDFQKLQNPFVTICDQSCSIISIKDTYIRCKAATTKERGCNVTIIGELNQQHQSFALQKPFTETVVSTTPSTDKPSSTSTLKILRIIVFCAASVLLLAIIICLYFYISKKFPRKIKQVTRERYNQVPDIVLDDLNEGTIRMASLKIIKKIGAVLFERNSAEVRLALYTPDLTRPNHYQEVAMKTARTLPTEPIQEWEIRKEIEMMQSCKHQNIVSFIGWARELSNIHIITEFMRGGSVWEFLRNIQNKPTIGQCFSFINQILDGMTYLSRNHIIHRDLATRNCLLNSTHEIVKISDFGLSRKTDMNYEYVSINNPRLPYRWLPIEALHQKTFSTKGDVWSFAVVIWELFQRGLSPYEGLDMHGVREYLDSGMRLSRPTYCPDELYSVMLTCWDQNIDLRPTFETLKVEIENILRAYLAQNPEQEYTEYERPIPVRSSAAPSSSTNQYEASTSGSTENQHEASTSGITSTTAV